MTVKKITIDITRNSLAEAESKRAFLELMKECARRSGFWLGFPDGSIWKPENDIAEKPLNEKNTTSSRPSLMERLEAARNNNKAICVKDKSNA